MISSSHSGTIRLGIRLIRPRVRLKSGSIARMTDFTDQEKTTLRNAAFGAMTLVSSADPGFFQMFKESMAGAKAMAGAPPDLRDVLKGGGMPTIPKGDMAKIESDVVQQLHQGVQILQEKAPQDLEGYRSVIVAACDHVANASKGMSESESAAITKVKEAIGAA